jgi:hypothetical protein
MAPLAPTSAPVVISAWLPKVNPVADAAQPEYEFSIDTTTGISAPPMGNTSKNPKTVAIPVIIKKEYNEGYREKYDKFFVHRFLK